MFFFGVVPISGGPLLVFGKPKESSELRSRAAASAAPPLLLRPFVPLEGGRGEGTGIGI